MLFLRVIAWYGAEKISLKKSCFYLYIRRRYVDYRYDKVITGSDQVFNFACTDFDKTYFLQFVKNCDNKLSYVVTNSFHGTAFGESHK